MIEIVGESKIDMVETLLKSVKVTTAKTFAEAKQGQSILNRFNSKKQIVHAGRSFSRRTSKIATHNLYNTDWRNFQVILRVTHDDVKFALGSIRFFNGLL